MIVLGNELNNSILNQLSQIVADKFGSLVQLLHIRDHPVEGETQPDGVAVRLEKIYLLFQFVFQDHQEAQSVLRGQN